MAALVKIGRTWIRPDAVVRIDESMSDPGESLVWYVENGELKQLKTDEHPDAVAFIVSGIIEPKERVSD